MRDLKELTFSGRPRAKLKKIYFSVTISRSCVVTFLALRQRFVAFVSAIYIFLDRIKLVYFVGKIFLCLAAILKQFDKRA